MHKLSGGAAFVCMVKERGSWLGEWGGHRYSTCILNAQHLCLSFKLPNKFGARPLKVQT